MGFRESSGIYHIIKTEINSAVSSIVDELDLEDEEDEGLQEIITDLCDRLYIYAIDNDVPDFEEEELESPEFNDEMVAYLGTMDSFSEEDM